MKPIEAGCWAMVINSDNKENVGKVVKVLRFVQANTSCTGGNKNFKGKIIINYDSWLIEGDVFYTVEDTRTGALKRSVDFTPPYRAFVGPDEGASVLPTYCLLRVDGFDDLKETDLEVYKVAQKA